MRAHARLLASATVLAVAVTTGITSSSAGAAAPATASHAATPAAADVPPHAVEDFVYPGAERILAERGITLVRGDGRIVLADCGPAGLIQARSGEKGLICFKALGDRGYLAVRIPDVYLMKGDTHAVTATLTANGEITEYDIARNEWTAVGEGTGGAPATLLEITASP